MEYKTPTISKNQTYKKMTWQATQVSNLNMEMGNVPGPGTNTQTVSELKLHLPSKFLLRHVIVNRILE